MRTLASRTLLLAALALGLSAAPLQVHAQSAQETADAAECTAYNLSADSLSRLIAADTELDATAKEDPELKKAWDALANVGDKSLSEVTDGMSTSAKLVAIADSHGFKPREFVVANIVFFSTGSVVAALKSGADRASILANPNINKANLELLESSPRAMDYLMKKMAG
jgi:hypothetical protein